MVVYLHRFAQRTLQSHSVGSSSNVTKTLGSFALAAFTAGLVNKMGCKSARLQYMPALFLGCCFRKWNLNGPQMQEPTRGDLFISPSLSFFSSFFYCDTTARTKLPKCVSGKQCVGISGGFLCRELHAFPSGSTPTRGEQNTANCCFD